MDFNKTAKDLLKSTARIHNDIRITTRANYLKVLPSAIKELSQLIATEYSTTRKHFYYKDILDVLKKNQVE
jgi:hypothetical protein